MASTEPRSDVGEQYKNANNLQARIGLHARFSTSPLDFYRWVFEHMDIPSDADLLELGCGDGSFWQSVNRADLVPASWRLTLTDLSQGMIAEARQRLILPCPTKFVVADAEDLSFESHSFDAVLANHMLYHVRDRKRAIAHIARVLRPSVLTG